MRPAVDLLAQYAEYHRDRRNIASHFVGIPMIVFALGVLLARPAVPVAGLALTPAWVVFAAAALWYLTRGELLLGVAVSAATAVLLLLAQHFAVGSTFAWLAWGIGLFVAGWIVQLVGHCYEGKMPAFVDDVVGLLVGPMFVVAEALFALGWRRSLLVQIEQRVGPTVLRDLAKIA
jgi:uncharacterized membrane protein YGL010W